MHFSVRDSLSRIGAPGSVQLREYLARPLPGYYRPSPPSSLASCLGSMRAPGFSDWQYLGRTSNDQTRKEKGDIQGLATDGTYWYLSFRTAIRKVSGQLDQGISTLWIPPVLGGYDHIGALCLNSGTLYAPLEYHGKERAGAILVVDAATSSAGPLVWDEGRSGLLWRLGPDGRFNEKKSNAWCALSPLDGMLYASDYDTPEYLEVFDVLEREPWAELIYGKALEGVSQYIKQNSDHGLAPLNLIWKFPWVFNRALEYVGLSIAAVENYVNDYRAIIHMLETGLMPYRLIGRFYVDRPSIPDQRVIDMGNGAPASGKSGHLLTRIGGGCFSKSGQLFLSCDSSPKSVLCFCGITGGFLGGAVDNDEHWEVEGIAVPETVPPTSVGGESLPSSGTIHIAFQGIELDDWDEADIKHWVVGQPETE